MCHKSLTPTTQQSKKIMDKICYALILSLLAFNLVKADQTEVAQGRDGTITLNDGTNSYWQSALIIIPILVIIIVLDFAIFGTFASRSDELNPISHFFFHARNGLQSLRNRRRHGYNPYHPDHHDLQQRLRHRHSKPRASWRYFSN